MGRVAVVGAGQSKYGEFPSKGIKELFLDAYLDMRSSVERNFEPKAIQAAYIGNLGCGGFQLGNMAGLMVEYVGLPHIQAYRVENACASSGFAFVAAVQAIRAGLADVVMAAGVEKMTDASGSKQKYWLGVSGDTEYERLAGTTFPGVYALIATRHMKEFGTTKEHLSQVAVKNHANGAMNPKAHFQSAIELDKALKAPMVAWPLNLFDCCPTSDGASAVLLTSEARAKEFTDAPIWVEGVGTATDWLALHDRPSITTLEATRRAADQAYKMAGATPKAIQFAEVHDCFTIAEILAVEDLGFCPKGQGGPYIASGETKLLGSRPVNASGGLKAKGHPIGATGTGQISEVFHQLRGDSQAPGRQLKGVELGLIHNVGGSGGTAAVAIFRRG